MTLPPKKKFFETATLILLLTVCGTGVLLYNVVLGYADVHYLWLADAFLHGRLDLSPELLKAKTFMDTVEREGRYYWPLGPLPAVLYMPAVAIFGKMKLVQGVAQSLFASFSFAAAFLLAKREGFTGRDPWWLATAFCFGSVMIGVIDMGMPWHTANLITAVFMLFALLEWRGKNRPLALGALLAMVVATRPQAIVVAAFFFVVDALVGGLKPGALKRLAAIAAPLALMLVLLGCYNAARFGSPFETGQSDHYLAPGPVADRRDEGGVFNLSRIPVNFAWYFLASPEIRDGLPVVHPDGVSVIILSPVFLWLFFVRKRDPTFIAAAVVTALSLLMYLSYFGTGSKQFGPRYLTDVLPLWYFLLLTVFKERGLGMRPKTVIAVSVAANAIMFHLFASYHIFRYL